MPRSVSQPADETKVSEDTHASVNVDRFGLSFVTACWVCLLSAMFCAFSHRPLWHTDLWSHLLYGEMIWQSKSIPSVETIMPLAEGTPIIDTAWLSQLIAHAVQESAGLAGLQLLYAACLTVIFAQLLIALYRKTESVCFSCLGLMVFAWITWWQFLVIRPQLAGVVGYLILFQILLRRTWSRTNWLWVPLIFLLWANLHGSFVVGLVLIGCDCAGRVIDLFGKTRRITSLYHDRRLRRGAVLLLLSGTVALINPYGAKLYEQVLTFSQNPNLRDLTEWWALTLRNSQGQAAAIVTVALIVLCRLNRRRFTTEALLPLIVMTIAMLWTSRMIIWWAPLASYQLAVHATAVWRTQFKNPRTALRKRRRGVWSAVSLGGVCSALALSPLGQSLLSGKVGGVKESVSSRTPVAAVEYLLEHPPAGQIFNAIEWGDYLAWSSARNGQDLKIFVASHVHLIPRMVWTDYMAIIKLQTGWEERLEKYDVETVILDRQHRRGLVSLLKRSPRWKTVYEDDRAVVFQLGI